MCRELKAQVCTLVITPVIIFPSYISRQLHFKGHPGNGRQLLSNNILLCCCICFPASAAIPIILNREIKEINGANMVRILEFA